MKSVDGKEASVVSASGMTRIVEATPTPAVDGAAVSDTSTTSNGIPQYLIRKKSDLQTATLTLRVSPPSESYADTYYLLPLTLLFLWLLLYLAMKFASPLAANTSEGGRIYSAVKL